MNNVVRPLLVVGLVTFAVVAQVSLLPTVAVNGVVPNLALLVVVAGTLVRGVEFGAVLGLVTGLLVDFAPPADHTAGRWALALVLVAVLTSRVSQDARRSPLASLATVAVCSFVGSSVFALSGLVLGDHSRPAGEMLQVIVIALLWDVVVAPLVLPVLMAALEKPRNAELAY